MAAADSPIVSSSLFPPFSSIEASLVEPGMAAILSECTSRLEALEALAGDEANATYEVVAT